VEGSEQPEEDFKASSAVDAPGMNYKNNSLDFRLNLIVRRTFASYRIARSQFPTVAYLIHAEACYVWMSCYNLVTFLVLCWTIDPATGDWPSHRVSARGINCIT
jgi:hypothetical protein